MDISKLISKDDIINQRCFDLNWLKENGLPSSFKNIKFLASGLGSKILNFVTPTNASWNGHNSSGWKQDLMEVNEMDESENTLLNLNDVDSDKKV